MSVTTLIAYVLAAAIPALAVYLIYLIDLFGTGKFSTVMTALAWGGVGAFSLALIINRFMQHEMGVSYENLTRYNAPIVEEILKSLILVYFITRPRFRYLVDGAIYGFAAGIGFAVIENFYYISGDDGQGAALSLAISRVLSASLMHATASSLVGIALGRVRRTQFTGIRKYGWPIVGGPVAILVHVAYNSAVQIEGLTPSLLLLLGITIGIGGSVIIGVIINQGLAEEKARFAETLGLDVGVTSAEVRALQTLGTNHIEEVLEQLSDYFGSEKADKIRRLLVTQANIGILSNNLRSPASERMKKAWQGEIDELRADADKLRQQIGAYVMSFLRGIFPEDDLHTWEVISHQAADYDPGHVHKFDVFILASQAADTVTAEKLEELGARLKKIEIFANVDLADLENLSRAIVERPYDDRDRLFKQGEAGDAMYMIEDGAINIYVDDGSGKEKYIRTYKAGAVVGEMALMDGQPRSATGRAHGGARVLVLRRQHFMMFVNSRPRVMMAVMEFLAERVRYTTGIVEDAIDRASAIAQGDYEKCLAWAPEAPSAAPTPAAAPTATQGWGNDQIMGVAGAGQTMATTMDLSAVLGAAPKSVGGAFAFLAAALETRESAMKDKVSQAKGDK